MSQTITESGEPISTVPVATTFAAGDTVLGLVEGPAGAEIASMVPRTVLLATVLPLTGGTMNGPVIAFELPTQPLELAAKQYVDNTAATLAQATQAAATAQAAAIQTELSAQAAATQAAATAQAAAIQTELSAQAAATQTAIAGAVAAATAAQATATQQAIAAQALITQAAIASAVAAAALTPAQLLVQIRAAIAGGLIATDGGVLELPQGS